MVTRLTPSDRDLMSLAQLVSQERPDLPEAGLPFSFLTEVVDQIPCDYLMFRGYDSVRQEYWFDQAIDPGTADLGVPDEDGEELHRAFWKNYWDCGPCSYPDRTGDLRPIVTAADFYSVRQWHSTAMYCDVLRPQGIEHQLGLCLPEPPRPEASAGRTIRLFLLRGPGLDFTERGSSSPHAVASSPSPGVPRCRTTTLSYSRSDTPSVGTPPSDQSRAYQHPDRS